MPQKMETGVREIVDVKEFASGSAATPDDEFGERPPFWLRENGAAAPPGRGWSRDENCRRG